jgi:hypothetical protein
MKDDRALDQLLKGMAAEHRAQLPGPGLIWWRAQLQKKQIEKERIERPLMMMRHVAAITCGAAFIALLAQNFGEMQTVLRNDSWFLMPPLVLTAMAAVGSWALPLGSRAKR